MESFPPPAGPVAVRDRLKEAVRGFLAELKERGRQPPSKKALALVAALALVVKAYLEAARESPRIYAQRNPFTECVLALLAEQGQGGGAGRAGIKRFRPGVLTWNGHLDTLFGFLRAHPPTLPSARELVQTPDGGHFALDWYAENLPAHGPAPTASTGGDSSAAEGNKEGRHARRRRHLEETRASLRTRPIVMILHGVNGHGNESYMRHLAHVVAERGWRAAVMTMRGCGDLTLSTPRAYDASKTEDLDLAVVRVHERYPQAPLFLVGFSLGANIMVKWLGEKGEGARGLVAAAVSVSNPWCFLPHIESLHYTSQRRPKPGLLRRLSARVYSMLIAHEYKRYVRRNMAVLEEPLKKAVTRPLEQMFTLRELDEHITVPLGGFASLEHYMTASSSSEVLDRVAVPLLGINARNDPFISQEALDHTLQQASRNPNVILVMTPTGGHIGWGEGFFLHLFRASWAERLTVDFIDACKLVQERGGIGGLGGGGGGLAPPRARL